MLLLVTFLLVLRLFGVAFFLYNGVLCAPFVYYIGAEDRWGVRPTRLAYSYVTVLRAIPANIPASITFSRCRILPRQCFHARAVCLLHRIGG